MMVETFKQVPLYRFRGMCDRRCESTKFARRVLDCGAGGDQPPLALFAEDGYETIGVDASKAQIARAEAYEKTRDLDLRIELGDMRHLRFGDGTFPFSYSYNSIFHMHKSDVAAAVNELLRVTQPGGLVFVNFLTNNDFRAGTGKEVGGGEFVQVEDGVPTIHSYFEPNEAEGLFGGLHVIYKEDRTLWRYFEGERIRQGFVDYVVER